MKAPRTARPGRFSAGRDKIREFGVVWILSYQCRLQRATVAGPGSSRPKRARAGQRVAEAGARGPGRGLLRSDDRAQHGRRSFGRRQGLIGKPRGSRR